MPLGIGKAEHMRRERQLRIQALLFARKIEADIADRVDRSDLIGKRAAADIGRARPADLGEQFLARRIRENLVEFVRQILPVVEQLLGHHADRIAVDRPRERHPIAIDDVGTRRNERCRRTAAGRGVEQREIEQTHRHNEKCRHEQQHQDHQTLLGGQQYLLPHPSGSNSRRTDDQRVHRPDFPPAASAAAARLRSVSVDSASN